MSLASWGAQWLVLLTLWGGCLVPQPTVPVRLGAGRARGLVAPQGTHARYTGLKYATVQGRFQAAKPVPKWEGLYNAYDEHIRCTQRFSSQVLGTEDCLTLNVYTPLPPIDHPLPVMVFIHGGGFRDGSASPLLYGPEYLTKHDVILVSINYRLEVLGFLCLGTKEAPGNAGLKDQVLALRWVQENIAIFGGDPDNVTIFGESAGSASVMYHLLSPMSEGLFHKAIMQSGSAVSPWSVQYDPIKTASSLAMQLGYNTKDPRKIYEIFNSLSAEELVKARVKRNEGDTVLSENIFVPCIEKVLPDEEQFLTDSPYNLLSKGNYNKVPIIIGYNSGEGYMFIGKENATTISNFSVDKSLPRDLVFHTEKERKVVAARLHEIYFGDDLPKYNVLNYARYQGDSGIVFPVVSSIDLLLKTSDKPVYAYKFSYEGWLNLAKITYGFWKYPGATHADELFYLFKVGVNLPISLLEHEFIDYFTSLWTNFAKYGDPTPVEKSSLPVKWEPTTRNSPKLFVINKNSDLCGLWDDERIKIWNITYTKYRRWE